MYRSFNTIGLAFTGEPEKLTSFFLNTRSDPDVQNLVWGLTRESFDDLDFYYFILKDADWSEADEIKRKALCRIANETELSYCFCLLNTRTNETVNEANHDAPFFNYRVHHLFGFCQTVEFKDLRYRNFKDWMGANFEYTDLKDICCHGAEHCGSLAYRSDTFALYEKYHDDIWEMLSEDCAEGGYKTIPELIARLNRSDVDNDNQFKNLLVWYAAERTAREVIDKYSEVDESSDDCDDEIYDDIEEE